MRHSGHATAGEPCLFNSQCASLSCSAEDEQCGVCDTLVGENEDCSVARRPCDFAFVCDETSQTCVKPGVTTPGELAEEGESCARRVNCWPTTCDSTGTCVPYPTLGMSCGGPRSCDFTDGSYCELDGLTCRRSPRSVNPAEWTAGRAPPAIARRTLAVTRRAPPSGSARRWFLWDRLASSTRRHREPISIRASRRLTATHRFSPALCARAPGRGRELRSCGRYSVRAGSAACAPTTTPRAHPRCAASSRSIRRAAASQATICHPGFSCTGGVCVPIDSQGLYDAVCQ